MKPITISLSPNTQKDDLVLVLKLLISPQKWIKGKAITQLEEEFKKMHQAEFAFSTNSGRSALFLLLKSLGIGSGDEILLQAFTCNAASNPILWAKGKPVFVDIDEILNLDPQDLEKKITPKAKTLITQHTFGQPAKIEQIARIAQKHGLFLIEDCAHSLGAKHQDKLAGTLGKAAFFSFGRDKVISSIFGGMLITNDKKLAAAIQKNYQELKFPSRFWILQQLLHPILFSFLILPSYNLLIGKALLVVFQKLKILSRAVEPEEKQGKMPTHFPQKLPNALAALALNQFKKLKSFNKHRVQLARLYQEGLKDLPTIKLPEISKDSQPVFLRYPVLTPKAEKILKVAKKASIVLGDWYNQPVAPKNTDLEKVSYQAGSCPKAEKTCQQILNLPTGPNITKEDAKAIIRFLKRAKENLGGCRMASCEVEELASED